MAQPAASDRAKHPRTALAGPYGHPFHPILITVPVGAWIASIVFDVLAIFAEDPSALLLGAQVLIAIGVVGAVVAAIFGFLDYSVIPSGTPAKRTAVVHMALNLVAVAVFAIDWFVRSGAGHDDVPVAGVVLSVVGLALIGASGYLGGKLAYHYGVRVAGEEKQVEGFTRR
jgi:uncharacterized membrane protein